MKKLPLILLLLLVSATVFVGCDYITGSVFKTLAPSQQQQIVNISAVEAYNFIQENADDPDFIIIDVRTPAEYNGGHIENAVLATYNSASFNEEINKYDRDKKYLIYCLSGIRSAFARDIMKELGFHHVYNMNGGISEWLAEGLPVVK